MAIKENTESFAVRQALAFLDKDPEKNSRDLWTGSTGQTGKISKIGENMLMDQAMWLLDDMMEYKQMMMAYACAIKEVRTKFDTPIMG